VETFADLLLARRDDPRVAVRSDDLTWTWPELIAAATARARIMTELRMSDRPFHVGVLLESTPEYLTWIYGAALARATIVGINPTRRGESLAADIRHTDCQLVVTDTARRTLLDGAALGLSDDRTVLVDSREYSAAIDQAAASSDELAADADADDLLLLLFTSGSTGAPKAVRCTTGRLATIARAAIANLGMSSADVTYQSMPMFHGNAIMANLAPAAALGVPACLRPRFSGSQFLADVRRYDATYFNYVGRSLAYVLATPERPDDAENSLRSGFGTEASLRDREEFSRRFGCELIERYGSSEGVITTHRPADTPPASIGAPAPRPGTDVAVVDPQTGRECATAIFDEVGRLVNAAEAIGELVDRSGAGTFEGYYRNEEAMNTRLHGGWYWSGDLAYRDADGFLFFAGRSNDWLRVDSENFAAAPVETILARLPGTVMTAVHAVPDSRTGDQVMAVFELAAGATFDPASFGSFLACQADLGTKWAPRFVRIVAAMPLTATNKVDKAPLRASAWATADPVYWRAGAALDYERFDAVTRADLEADFARHGRDHLLPIGEPLPGAG